MYQIRNRHLVSPYKCVTIFLQLQNFSDVICSRYTIMQVGIKIRQQPKLLTNNSNLFSLVRHPISYL